MTGLDTVTDRWADRLDARELADTLASAARYVLVVVYRDVPHERRVTTEAEVELRPAATTEDALGHLGTELAIWGSDAENVCEAAYIYDRETGEEAIVDLAQLQDEHWDGP